MLDGFQPAALAQLHRELDEPTVAMPAVRVDLTQLDAAVEALIDRLDQIVDVLRVGRAPTEGDDGCRTAALLLRTGSTDQALEVARAVAGRSPGEALPELILALVHLRQGSTTRALRHLQRAVRTGADHEPRTQVTAALIAAAVLDAADRTADAVAVLEEAYQLGPSIPVLLNLILHGRTEPATGQLLELMASNPVEIPADLPLGLLGDPYLDRRGDVVAAHDALRRTAEWLAERLAELRPNLRPVGEVPRSPRRRGRDGRQARRLVERGLTFDVFRRQAATELRNIRAIDKARRVVERYDEAVRTVANHYDELVRAPASDLPLWRLYLEGRKLRVVVTAQHDDLQSLVRLRADAADATDELRALLGDLDAVEQPMAQRLQTELRNGWLADRRIFLADQEELLARVERITDALAGVPADAERRPIALAGWTAVDRRPSRRPLFGPLVDLPLPVPVGR